MGVPKALTVAGSDSGGGAGIQADLKTFSAFRVFGMSVLTAVTAQNSLGVTGVHDLPPEFVARQLDAVLDDFGADAVKLGMLSNAGIIRAVADRLRAHNQTRLVLDPVMIAKSGASLLQPEARTALIADWKDEARTAIALELAAAQLLARVAAPVMPRFAARLARALGTTDVSSWPAQVELVAPGSRIDLEKQSYFEALPSDGSLAEGTSV